MYSCVQCLRSLLSIRICRFCFLCNRMPCTSGSAISMCLEARASTSRLFLFELSGQSHKHYKRERCTLADNVRYASAQLYGKVSEKRDLACIIKKHNKNALRLKCYNFRRVNAIVFLFSVLHITPFLYGKILFGILHLLLASIATFDTPPGSNPP